MSYSIKSLENTHHVAGVAFFLFFLMIMEVWAHADELLESEFFENSFEEKKILSTQILMSRNLWIVDPIHHLRGNKKS